VRAQELIGPPGTSRGRAAYAGWRKVGTFPNPTKLQNDNEAGAVPARLLLGEKAPP
jgi:hypothetical protein